jgi:hypothetical protein
MQAVAALLAIILVALTPLVALAEEEPIKVPGAI